MREAQKIVVGEKEISLDSNLLSFNEASLSKYIEEEGSWYDYFGAVLSDAEKEFQLAELSYDTKYSEIFSSLKDDGGSDKLVEAKTKAHPEVVEAKNKSIACKYNVSLVKRHLMAWDINHDNSQSLGHSLRKQMDKLNGSIYHSKDDNFDKKLEEIIDEGTND